MNLLSFKVVTAATIPDLNPAWSNDQLNIKFAFSREGNVLTINLEAANQTLADEITDFVFQGIVTLNDGPWSDVLVRNDMVRPGDLVRIFGTLTGPNQRIAD